MDDMFPKATPLSKWTTRNDNKEKIKPEPKESAVYTNNFEILLSSVLKCEKGLLVNFEKN